MGFIHSLSKVARERSREGFPCRTGQHVAAPGQAAQRRLHSYTHTQALGGLRRCLAILPTAGG